MCQEMIRMIPEEFLFGASLSGFQFEMGGDREIIDENTDWFRWVHDEMNILTGVVSGDLPEDGPGYWRNFNAFHDLAEEAGMNSLRIGVEWSRIFPKPTFDVDGKSLRKVCDMNAVDHYRSIMSDIKQRGMKLMVNLNHFTLPIWCHDPVAVNRRLDLSCSGWLDKRTANEFSKYASFAAECFDDLVDFWSTLNEPNIVAMLGYFSRESGFPPSIIAPDLWNSALENQVDAHRLAYREIKKISAKPVGMLYATVWLDGDSSKERAMDLLNWNPLDSFLSESDFLGINYYSRNVVETVPGIVGDSQCPVKWKILDGYGYSCTPGSRSRSGNLSTDNGWEFYPEGLYRMASEISRRYSTPLLITENGVADAHDIYRPRYLTSHFDVIERLLDEGVDLRGYLHWSLTDNYEWALGMSMKFGLAGLDPVTGELVPRPSLYLYREIIRSRSVSRFLSQKQQKSAEGSMEVSDGYH
jgi:beta-glucosidase/6-phospho-beta-glucosidase/beta-galactosidase